MSIESWFELSGIIVAVLGGGIVGGYKIAKAHGKKLISKNFPSNEFWSLHTRIHEILTELRLKTDCARAQLVQFHNTGYFLDGISMKKMSLTHESLEAGVASEMEGAGLNIKTDILLTLVVDSMVLMMDDEPHLHITEQMKPCHMKNLLHSNAVVAFSFLPVKGSGGQVVGYTTIHWCSLNKMDEIEESTMMEAMMEARDEIEIELSIEQRQEAK
jgi:hypothetical protein